MQAVSAILLLLPLLPLLMMMTMSVPMAQADHISDSLQLPPLKEHRYLFDVISESPLADVKAALNSPSLEIHHSFKEVGKKRYVFVVMSNDTAALRTLSFPAGSEVTQYPVVLFNELLTLFGEPYLWKEVDSNDTLPDTELTMHDFQLLGPETECPGQFTEDMTQWVRNTEHLHSLVRVVSYAVIACYPPRVFFFYKIEYNVVQHITMEATGDSGGPGRSIVTITRIVKI